tara:strand:- start:219 stop:503 length:285 start_codon:yes stop_codon:yes gene_type:complete
VNEYDRQNVQEILNGHGDWFGAVLLRAIALGNAMQRGLLFISYPVEVQSVANLDIAPGEDPSLFNREIERLYIKADAENQGKLRRCFSRFEGRG